MPRPKFVFSQDGNTVNIITQNMDTTVTESDGQVNIQAQGYSWEVIDRGFWTDVKLLGGQFLSAFIAGKGGRHLAAFLKGYGGKHIPAFIEGAVTRMLRNSGAYDANANELERALALAGNSATVQSFSNATQNRQFLSGASANGNYIYYVFYDGTSSNKTCHACEYNVDDQSTTTVDLSTGLSGSGIQGTDISFIDGRKVMIATDNSTDYDKVFIVDFEDSSYTTTLSGLYWARYVRSIRKADGDLWLYVVGLTASGWIFYYKNYTQGDTWSSATISDSNHLYNSIPLFVSDDYLLMLCTYMVSGSGGTAYCYAIVLDLSDNSLSRSSDISYQPGYVRSNVLISAVGSMVENGSAFCTIHGSGANISFPPYDHFEWTVEYDPYTDTLTKTDYNTFVSSPPKNEYLFGSADHIYKVDGDNVLVAMDGGSASGTATNAVSTHTSIMSDDGILFYQNAGTIYGINLSGSTVFSMALGYTGTTVIAVELSNLGDSLVISFRSNTGTTYYHQLFWIT